MIVGRIVTGFGMGHVTATCPVWAVSILVKHDVHQLTIGRLRSLVHLTAVVVAFHYC